MSDSVDQRQYPRIDKELVLSVKKETDLNEEVQEAKILNISLGGAFIETSNPYELGEVLKFRLKLPDRDEAIHVDAIVKWQSTDSPKGVGVEYLNVETDQDSPLVFLVE